MRLCAPEGASVFVSSAPDLYDNSASSPHQTLVISPNKETIQHDTHGPASVGSDDVYSSPSVLVWSHISEPPEIPNHEVEVYSDLIVCRRQRRQSQSSQRRGGGKRGVITSYSLNSQRRFRNELAKIRNLDAGMFVTLTYPDCAITPEQAKADLNCFFRRVKRAFGDAVVMVWRVGIDRRESGVRVGQLMPHFHLILLNLWDSSKEQRDPRLARERFMANFGDNPKFAATLEKVSTLQRRRFERPPSHHNSTDRWLHAFYLWLVVAWTEIVYGAYMPEREVRVDARYMRENTLKVRTYITRMEEEKDRPRHGENAAWSGRYYGIRGKPDVSSTKVTLTRAQVVELRRAVVAYLYHRGGLAEKHGNRINRIGVSESGLHHGFHVFGMGDSSHPQWTAPEESTIYRMLKYIGEL